MTAAKERRFFDALRDVFIGVPVEGESGYINLMRIKARYFQRVLEPHLQRAASDEMRALRQSGATDTEVEKVREEIFDKLYTFFRRYFTESGSLGFFFTPLPPEHLRTGLHRRPGCDALLENVPPLLCQDRPPLPEHGGLH
jgi:adenine-specific DNA-methyltransferase